MTKQYRNKLISCSMFQKYTLSRFPSEILYPIRNIREIFHSIMSSVLLRTNVDKLSILPSGAPHAKATELLASDAMSRLLEDMATRYADRIIIFDSPPLLLTTESRVLATHMGQIVMVVQAGRTQQSEVRHALSTIEACPVRLMVLNKARTDGPGAYGYGYGYGAYGYGYGHGPEADAAAQQAPAASP